LVEENIIHYKSVSFSHVVLGNQRCFFGVVAQLVVHVVFFGIDVDWFFLYVGVASANP